MTKSVFGKGSFTVDQLIEQNKKLIEFVKECAKGEKYLNTLRVKYLIPNELDEISMRATNLLKEIGESE